MISGTTLAPDYTSARLYRPQHSLSPKPSNPNPLNHSLPVGGAARRSLHCPAGLKGCASPPFVCWFGCASLDGMGRPLDPSRLGFWVLRSAPMASIARKQSLSRFSSELLDELSYCCQLAANPCLRLGALADEILIERIRELPEPELDPEILAMLPY